MKKLLLIIVLALKTSTIFAQDTATEVEVIGNAYFKRTPDKYSTEIVISESLSYNYNNSNCYSDIKGNYFKKLVSIGVDTTKIKEDKLGYLTKGYSKKGTIYFFETKELSLFKKVLEIKADGVQNTSQYIEYKELSDEELLAIKNEAIKSAEKNVKTIAKALNKNVSQLTKLKDINYNYSFKNKDYYSYSNEEEKTYTITATYEIK